VHFRSWSTQRQYSPSRWYDAQQWSLLNGAGMTPISGRASEQVRRARRGRPGASRPLLVRWRIVMDRTPSQTGVLTPVWWRVVDFIVQDVARGLVRRVAVP